MPKVSVIMNCLNGERYLKEAIDSVFAQTYTDWEIVFWDNASTDDSAKIARGYGEKVRYFRSLETYPLGKARNLAVEKAQGDYVAFLDCDDIWLPQKLEKQIPLFTDSRVGLVYSNALCFINGTKYIYPVYPVDYRTYRGHIFSHLLNNNLGLTLSTVVIRRTTLDNIEWFPESMNVSEEYDLFLRICYNWSADYIKEPLVKYRIHGQNISNKGIELQHHDLQLVLKRLYRFFPDIEERYNKEITNLKTLDQLVAAHVLWKKGRNHEARKVYLELLQINKDWKPLIFLLFTFFCSFEQFSQIKIRMKYLAVLFYSIYRRLNP